MNKLQRHWPSVAQELSDQLRSCDLSINDLAIASGVDYYAIRRFRKDGVRNKTNAAVKLCTYFNILMTETKEVQKNELDKLISELNSAWDGSESHAQLLTELIRITKYFKVKVRLS